MFQAWYRRKFTESSRRKPIEKRRGFKPWIEALESRTVPTTIVVNPLADDATPSPDPIQVAVVQSDGDSVSSSTTADVLDGGSTTSATTDTVLDVNFPVSNVQVNLSASTIDEGGSTTLTGTFTDADAADTHTVTIDWGDGSPDTVLHLAAGVTSFSQAHTYADDHPTGTSHDAYTIGVTVVDDVTYTAVPIQAYVIPSGTAGNQAFGGALGMDFNVVRPIWISQLGVFDDLSDGLMVPLTARLYNRANQTSLATLSFAPGQTGTLVSGTRFLPLATPILLPAGFQGTIVAEGYGATERNGNFTTGVWTTDSGDGAIQFVGGGRNGVAGVFPVFGDGGPANRYAAGSFRFHEPLPGEFPNASANVTVNNVVPLGLSLNASAMDGNGTAMLTGTFTDPGTADTHTVTINWGDGSPDTVLSLAAGETTFSQAHTYAAQNPVGFTVSVTVVDDDMQFSTAATQAYLVPQDTAGNQAFGGSMGMDFNVVRPILVTHLGVFDDLSNGLMAPLTGSLYDRATQALVATLAFAPGQTGTLLGGTRYLPLATPILLPAGFQGTIVAQGYGATERNGNFLTGVWTTDSGGGAIQFVGSARASAAGGFPSFPDGGPANRYAAGSFIFSEPFTDALPGATVTVVANAPPMLAADAANVSTAEGTPATNSGTFSDPQGNNTVSLSADVGTVTQDSVDGTWSWSMPATDDAGPITVTITADDHVAPLVTTTFTYSVANVAPTVDAGPNPTHNTAGAFSSSGSFTDPGADTWTATVDYGDGTGPQALALNFDKTFDLVRDYAADGVYTITVTVADDDGGSHSDSFVLTLNRFTVDTTADTVADDGLLSLREAILNANAMPGLDTIDFNIPGSGVRTISLMSALPTITDAVVIDGYTQPGSNANTLAVGNDAVLRIQLDGAGAGSADGLTLGDGSAGSTIKGLIVSNFRSDGASGLRLTSGDHTIQGNWIGLGTSGTTAAGNFTGISLSSGNLVGTNGDGVDDFAERNVISGNTNVGILATGGNNTIAGNYVGVNADGTATPPVISESFDYPAGQNVTGQSGGTGWSGSWLQFGSDTGWTTSTGSSFPGLASSGQAAGENVVFSGNDGNRRTFDTATFNSILATGEYWFSFLVSTTGTLQINPFNGGGSINFPKNIEFQGSGRIQLGGDTAVSGTTAANNAFTPGQTTYVVGRIKIVGAVNDGVNDIFELYVNPTPNTVPSAATRKINALINFQAPAAPGVAIQAKTPGAQNAFDEFRLFASPAPLGNGVLGVWVASADNTVRDNVISGNGGNGLQIHGSAATGNLVEGNLVGLNAGGTAAVGNGWDGIVLDGGAQHNTLRGNTVSGNTAGGISLVGAGTSHNLVQGNFIGTDADGSTAVGNAAAGVLILDGSNNTIGGSVAGARNVIGGNGGVGVFVTGAGSDGNVIAGNYIGVDATGTARLQNLIGILVAGGASDTRIGTDGDGIGDAAERNVISGHVFEGVVVVNQTTTGTIIAGNYIGTNAAGAAAIANGNHGIAVRFGAQNTRIGTDGSADAFNANERNVISGNPAFGILVQTPEFDGTLPSDGVQTDHTVIAGNYIGLDAAGTSAIGNAAGGILVQSGAQNTRIGTDDDGVADVAERNVISGNIGWGIDVASAGNTVQGNYVGVDAAGTMAVANAAGDFQGFATLGGLTATPGTGAGNLFGGRVNLHSGASTVQGNTFGLAADGTTALATGSGILLTGQASTIGGVVAGARNVFGGAGIDNFNGNSFLDITSTGHTVGGNYFGTDITGLLVRNTAERSIQMYQDAAGNTIGGDDDDDGSADGNVQARNVVAGGVRGIEMYTSDNTVQGNYVGVGADGVTPLGINGVGIFVRGAGNLIGGTTAGAGNVVSAVTSNWGAIRLEDTTTGSVVAGNFIGTNAAGTAAVPNSVGVSIGSNDNIIGGASPEARNLISGNLSGIVVDPGRTGNVLTDNHVGTQAGGVGSLPNTTLSVSIATGAVLQVGGILNGNVINDGTLDLAGNAVTIVGAFTGVGTVTNSAASGTATLTVNGVGVYDGVIQDGASAQTAFAVTGGAVTLAGANTYSGSTTIDGSLIITGSIVGSATVNSGGTLSGTGQTGPVAVDGGTLAPGVGVGLLSTANLGFAAGSTYAVAIDGDASGAHDQTDVTGTISLGGATLDVSGTITGATGDIILLNNDSDDAVIGTFNGLAEGAAITINGVLFHITYHGGTDDNDVVLSINQPPTIDDQAFAIDENAANGTVVGAVVAEDPDAGATLEYSIIGGNTDGAFAIDPSTGLLTVANKAALDYETNPVFDLTVQVEDDHGETDEATVTVNLNDLNALVTIDNVTHDEGDSLTAYTFTVTSNAVTNVAFTAQYSTANDTAGDGSANTDSDYAATSGTLHFSGTSAGETQQFTVNVSGDDAVELDETFFANLIGLAGTNDATIANGSGLGTILNDDHAPIADAGGPYVIDEGDGLTLDASATFDNDTPNASLTYGWDVDGDGDFDENVTGVSPTLSAAQMASLGLGDGTGSRTVTLLVSDGVNSDTATSTLTINNVAPTIISLNFSAASINEGQSVSVTGAFTDPALGAASETFTGTATWSDGVTTPVTITGGNFSTTRTFADDHPLSGTASDTFSLNIHIQDDDGGVSAPYLSGFGPELIVNGSFEDGDFSPVINGSWVNVIAGSTRITGWTVGGQAVDWHNPTHFNAPHTGTKIIDLNLSGFGIADTGAMLQTIATVPGQSYRLSFFLAGPNLSFPDPREVRVTVAGVPTIFSAPASPNTALAWYERTLDFTATSAATTLEFSSVNGSGFWGALLDDVSVVARQQAFVTVNNVAPTIAGVNFSAASIDEGQSVTVTGSFTDPALGVGTESFTGSAVWSDGAMTPLTIHGDGTFNTSRSFADDNPTVFDTFTVAITIEDDDLGSTTVTSDPITVNNVAPEITDLNLSAASIDEGQSTTLSGTIIDPGVFDTFTLDINWGDPSSPGNTQSLALGSSPINAGGVTWDPATRQFTVQHQYLDDNPSGTASDVYTIGVTVTDGRTETLLGSDGVNSDTATTTLTISNVAPELFNLTNSSPECGCPGGAFMGEAVTINAGFTDIGTLDSHTAIINWGDGTTSLAVISESGGSGTLTGSHVYAAGGIFTIVVTLTDDDGGAVWATTTTTVGGVGLTVDGELQIIGTSGRDIVQVFGPGQFGAGADEVRVRTRFDIGGSAGNDWADSGDDVDSDCDWDDEDLGTWSYGQSQVFTFDAADVNSIRMILCGGDDRAVVSRHLDIDAFIDGGQGDDVILSGAGDDTIIDLSGNNRIHSRLGNDTVTTGGGHDRVWTGGGDDVVSAGNGHNRIHTGDGDDQVTSGTGCDRIWTGSGDDTADAGEGDNRVHAGSGSDTVAAGNGRNRIWTDGGFDTITLGHGNNEVHAGGGGNVVIVGNGNNDIWTGGGGSGDDVVVAGNGNNDIHTGAGHDAVTVGGGANRIWTGGGNDIIVTGHGDNEIRSGAGNDTITTGSGNDRIWSDGGDDVIDAGDGTNEVRAGAGNDTIITGNARDVIDAGSGNDRVRSGAGDDSVQGGAGDDILIGGQGDDLIIGGDGRDFLIGGSGADRIVGNQDEDILVAGYTSYDADDVALGLLMAEWTGAGSNASRTGNILNGAGLTTGYRLDGNDGAGQTVFNDSDCDTLTGSQGVDWFFANLVADDGGPLDKITDKAASELWTDIDF